MWVTSGDGGKPVVVSACKVRMTPHFQASSPEGRHADVRRGP